MGEPDSRSTEPSKPGQTQFLGSRNFPMWVQATAFLIGTLGFPVVYGLMTLAQNAGWVTSPASVAVAGIKDVITKTDALRETVLAQELRHEDLQSRLLTGIRILCENDALRGHDQVALNNCKQIR